MYLFIYLFIFFIIIIIIIIIIIFFFFWGGGGGRMPLAPVGSLQRVITVRERVNIRAFFSCL